MRRRSRHSRSHVTTLAELNITPMLDLAFVLLIIFMITAPLLASRVDLILPTTKAAREAVAPDSTVLIEINQGGLFEIDETIVSLEALGERIDALRKNDPDLGVILQAHEGLTLAELMPVLDLLKLRGITDTGIVAKREANQSGGR